MIRLRGMSACKPYPSDVSDDEWALVAPYLALLPEDAGQREHNLREVFNGLRDVIKTGAPWRWMPNDLPPWAAVYQQAQRWLAAGCFEALAEDLRSVLRIAAGRKAQPSAAILDSRTLRSSPESGTRKGSTGQNVELDMTAQNARKVRSCTWRSARWAICWRCTSRPPARTTGPKLGGWPRPCRAPPARTSN